MGCLTAKASGTVASFISPTVTDIESARVYFSPTQLGEGTPSPDNVREIVGRTSVELKQCGKNLFDGEVLNARFKDGIVGEPIQTESTGSWRISKNRIEVKGGSKLYCYTKYGELVNSTNRPWIVQTDENDNYISFTSSYTPPLTLDTNTKYIRFQITSTVWNNYNPYFFTTTPLQIKTIPFSWKRLPDEYQEVEYIESDGTSYLDLNYVPVGDEKFELLFSYIATPSVSKSYLQLFGCREIGVSASNKNCWLGIDSSDILYSRFGTINIEDSILMSKGKHTIIVDLKNTCLSIDNNNYYFNNSIISDINMSMYLGYMHAPTSGMSLNPSGIGQYNNFIIYNNNNEVIHNFIPCYRKSDNEIGMYDTVSQTFYTNQGTGTFTKGDDVFSDEVYGGYVDLVKGEIVATHYSFTLDGINYFVSSYGQTYTGTDGSLLAAAYDYISVNSFKNLPMGVTNSIPNSISNKYLVTGNHKIIGIQTASAGTPYYRLVVSASELDDISNSTAIINSLKIWLQNNPIQICYKLAEPITYQLPDYLKTQLQTLKNENTFWSNGDSVEIDYDLAETFDIQKAKRKIIMNQPHVESASNSPSSPQVIKFKTDMKAPLKECIVNFAPIQEGSGDQSPTNIRPIKGWNGITLKHTGINMLQCSSPSYYIDATNNGITSQSSKNADNEVIGIDFNGTTTSTNIFRNLNYNPSDSGAVTMPRGLMGLTGYSDQVYVIPMGNGNAPRPRTTDGRYWSGANTNSENGWNVWSVDSSETYNGLWVRTQVLPRESNINVDTTVYPMMCLAEDVGCEFEPYKGETFDVDWIDDAGTVYGGYVDLINGQLVEKYKCFRLDSNTPCSKFSSNGLYTTWSNITGIKAGNFYDDPNAMCNSIKKVSARTETGVLRITLGDNVYLYNMDSVYGYTTIEEVSAWLDENPIYVTLPLATPIVHQLTPQQIVTFKGQNNIWANTNKLTEIKYWNHKKSDSTGIVYEAENLVFDGTNYIDTGVYLFSEENINRDFEVVIEDLYGSANTYQHQTIVCAKYDSTAIGFLIRLNSQTIAQYNGTIGMKKDNHNNITIKRINGVITIDGEVITNPTVKFTNTIHNHPLVLGCALEDNGTPMRYATGTIGHITVKWL